MGKYAPLTRFLREQDAPRLTLRFDELEEILGFSLPESAFRYPSWWANSAKGQSQVKGWRDAGWETRDVDLRGRKVTFVRVAGEPVVRAQRKGQADGAQAPAGGAAAGTAAADGPAAAAGATAAGGGDGGGDVLAGVVDPARLPPALRRLLESRAARHGRTPAAELAAIVQAAMERERALLVEELAQMRERTRRPGAFQLLDVLGRK